MCLTGEQCAKAFFPAPAREGFFSGFEPHTIAHSRRGLESVFFSEDHDLMFSSTGASSTSFHRWTLFTLVDE